MRRLTGIVLVAMGALLVSPQAAAAQGFWRWFERLSGPEISGPGFDAVFLCQGVRRGGAGESGWFASPYCVDARRDQRWISVGAEVYALAGDNDQTQQDDDRVDVTGIMPFVDFNIPQGFAFGAGVGIRRYSAGAGSFNKPVVEGVVKWRPLTLLVPGGTGREAPSLRHDLLELRLALVYQGEFEARQFGRGSPALDADVSPVFIIAFNLVR
jgi:hypothetical protein